MSKTDTITLNAVSHLIFTTAPWGIIFTTALKTKNWRSEKEIFIHAYKDAQKSLQKILCSCDCDFFLKNLNNFSGSGPENTMYIIYS